MGLSRVGVAAADDLIRTYRLHDAVPVDLSPVEERYPQTIRDLGPNAPRAFAVPPLVPDGAAWVVIDSSVWARDRRILYAHEIAHLLLGHAGSLRVMEGDGWLHDRQEREAWALAAYLLIPGRFVELDDTHDDIAVRCGVPSWLVAHYERHVRTGW